MKTGNLSLLFLMAVTLAVFSSCGNEPSETVGEAEAEPLKPVSTDELALAEGFTYQLLVKAFDTLHPETVPFGFDVSGLTLLPDNGNGMRLAVNHQYMSPLLVTGYNGSGSRLRVQIDQEQQLLGTTILPLEMRKGRWQPGNGKPVRITGNTPVKMQQPIGRRAEARGTVSNRALCVTPWNSLLSAESNFTDFYGEYKVNGSFQDGKLDWVAFLQQPPALYGWIVELDNKGRPVKKLMAPGRLQRGGLAITSKNGRNVLYYTENTARGGLYKFVSDSENNLDAGKIYAASLEENRWIPVTDNPAVNQFMGLQTPQNVLINLSEASRVLGATQLANPAGVVVHPATGQVMVAIGENPGDGRYHGAILSFTDNGETFNWDTVLEGGPDTGLSVPADLAYDNAGNLWVSTDIPPALVGKGVYTPFGNNGLFRINQGKALQIASAPTDARFSGMAFTEDGKYLFLGVQHPGSLSRSKYDFDFTSHWPEGGKAKPKSAVVVIHAR